MRLKTHLDQKRIEKINFEIEYAKVQELNSALSNLDEEGLKELIENGLNLKEYESKHGSTILSALSNGFIKTMLDDFKQLDKKNYFNYFFKEFSHTEINDLPVEIQEILRENVRKLLSTMDLLCSNGASLNANCGQDTESHTIFSSFISYLDYFKSLDVILFFLNNPEFDLNSNVCLDHDLMSELVHDDSNISTVVLKELINRGLPYESSPSLNAYAGEFVNGIYIQDDLINPIIECLAFAGKTKKEKLDLIFPMAPLDQQNRYSEAYKKLASSHDSNLENGEIKL